MSGYHTKDIPKGKLGEFSKIREEFLELEDAIESDNPLMALQECSDLLGAIEAYAAKYNLTISDLYVMLNTTKRVFITGHRQSSDG